MVTIEFSIDKNTPSTNLKRQIYDLGVNSKSIKSIEIVIPPEHKGLAYLRVLTPGSILIPSIGSSVQFVRGEETKIPTTINRTLEGPPYYIICEGYNEDKFLSHSFIINIEV